MFGAKPLTTQCWFIVNWILKITLQWNSYQNIIIFIQRKTSENVICNMVAIFRDPNVKIALQPCDSIPDFLQSLTDRSLDWICMSGASHQLIDWAPPVLECAYSLCVGFGWVYIEVDEAFATWQGSFCVCTEPMRHYIEMSSLIGWVYAQNDPWWG